MSGRTVNIDGRIIESPTTFRERVAWAICAHDNSGAEGRLSPDELRGLELLFNAVWSRAGGSLDRAGVARFLGVSRTVVEQSVLPLMWLMRVEKARRDGDGITATTRAHWIAADWPNYLGAADAAIGVLSERPEAVLPIPEPAEVEATVEAGR